MEERKAENLTKEKQNGLEKIYKNKIIELVEEIDRQEILVKIYSFIMGIPNNR